ncbi:MAG: YceH family protein [Phycisphaerae bacterium]
MSTVLHEVERRVLGVLLEKSLAQPSYYPMTLNAVVTACNQKSNRQPVMDLNEDRVWAALDALKQMGLVSRLLPGGGSRVDRFRHEVKQVLAWEKPQRAVMAELLLRGPQTVGELRSHAARMYPFENPAAVSAVLDSLAQSDPPMVTVVAPAPGQSATRYAHLLCPVAEQPAATATPVAAPAPAASAPAADDEAEERLGGEGFQRQLDDLHAEMAELREAVAELKRRLPAPEQEM